MHLLLTDRLICPRCGPGFGLILLADRLEDRRLIEGSLGCSNCRDRFPVAGGFGDLRPPPRKIEKDVPGLEPPASPPVAEVAALLGLAEGAGSVALIGHLAGHATVLAELVPGVEVVGVAAGLRAWEEGDGVSRLVAGSTLPFGDSSLRGIGLFAECDPSLAIELARVVAPTGRVAVWGPVQEWEKRLIAAGLDVLASQETAVVAEAASLRRI
jgi:hypothetical protein